MDFTTRRERYRGILAGDKCVYPGSVFDPISARIAEDLGFEVGMFAGSIASGTVLGAPDLIVLTLTEFAQQIFAAPVRLGVPAEGLGGIADVVARPRFTVGAGLALWGADRFAETGRGASTRASGIVTRLGVWLKEFF